MILIDIYGILSYEKSKENYEKPKKKIVKKISSLKNHILLKLIFISF